MERAQKIIATFEDEKTIFRRDFTVGKRAAVMLFHPDITDEKILRAALMACTGTQKGADTLQSLLTSIVTACEASVENDESTAIQKLLEGDAVVFLDGEKGYVDIAAKNWTVRAVTEPPTETVVRGPREGFIEDFVTNVTLLEKRLRTPAFAVKKFKIGREGNTLAGIAYIGGIADKSLIAYAEERIKQLDIDAVSDSHYLVPLLEENPRSVFPQVGMAEKPDIVAAKLLEGRVAVIVDGSPIVLTLPFFLIEDFHSAEDHYQRSGFSTFLRLLRLGALFLAVFLPGLYVAAMTYHYEILPLKLLITVLNALKGISLPPMWEILFILLLFEIIREASVRMPKSVSTAMSIVGALVLGDTAVKAGIISSPGVLIIALSSLALYVVPALVGTTSLLRMLFTVIGGLGGLYGLTLASAMLVFYLCGLSSAEKPYLAPFAPLIRGDLKDAAIKAPLGKMVERPRSIGSPNKRRMKA